MSLARHFLWIVRKNTARESPLNTEGDTVVQNDNENLHSRVGQLESSVGEVLGRVEVHERALFGGYNADTGKPHPGLFNRVDDTVEELKQIRQILNRAVTGFMAWIGRFVIMILGGVATVFWFLFTHWKPVVHLLDTTAK